MGSQNAPRRARPSRDFFAWVGQAFPEDPDDDEGECWGDRNGEPAEKYDVGCMILAVLGAGMASAAIALLIVVAVGG